MRCPRVIELHLSTSSFIGRHRWDLRGLLLHLLLDYGPCLDLLVLLLPFFFFLLSTGSSIRLLATLVFIRPLAFLPTAFCPAIGPNVAFLVAIEALNVTLLAFLSGIHSKSLVLGFVIAQGMSIILIKG
jgi:hypothetical protein